MKKIAMMVVVWVVSMFMLSVSAMPVFSGVIIDNNLSFSPTFSAASDALLVQYRYLRAGSNNTYQSGTDQIVVTRSVTLPSDIEEVNIFSVQTLSGALTGTFSPDDWTGPNSCYGEYESGDEDDPQGYADTLALSAGPNNTITCQLVYGKR